MSNIYSIAEKTGFSASTVARALSGNGYCGKKTRELILQTAQEMNYMPVLAAKTLKSKITKKIMFCIPDICNPYYFKMINAVNRVVESYGYYTILVHSEHNAEKELEIINAIKSRFVDGLIIGSFDFSEILVETIRQCALPVVLTNLYETENMDENFDCVYVDHTRAVYLAAVHLLEQGHRDICFLTGSLTEQTSRERLSGYQKALGEFGLSWRRELVIESDFTREGGYRDFSFFMENKQMISAALACNDLMAVGCMNYCREQGIDIPGDISIISLDDTDYCLCTSPQLSSVDMKQYKIGEHSALLLMERIREKRSLKKIVCLEPALVIRSSVERCIQTPVLSYSRGDAILNLEL